MATVIRPISFDEFHGQGPVVEHLKIAIRSALKQEKPLGHVLLVGMAGIGKTTLGSSVIPNALGVDVTSLNCAAVEKVSDFIPTLTSIPRGSVLFLDEIHNLIPAAREHLLTVMEDQYINVPIGDGEEIMKVSLDPFTVIGATTRQGVLPRPLLSRFVHDLRLSLYTDDEMREVLCWTVDRRALKIQDIAAERLVPVCHGTARKCVNLVEACADTLFGVWSEEITKDGDNVINIENVDATLKRLGYREDLSRDEWRYLEAIASAHKGRAGIKTLSALLDETERTIEEIYEPWLIQSGYIVKESQGRRVTDKGKEVYDRLRER